ncbi:MAG: ribonuclease P protein component [Candidatus Omnitrophota bacterium]|nr:ribonuclease P protein component [Candidatus Omnitrophota bacterium]
MNLNSFSRKERLKKNDAIKAVLDRGICYRSKSINIYVLKRPDADVNKAAFICKKALHQKKSVLRNRVRRILKEAYRKTRHIFPAGHDIVIIGTKITQAALSTEIEREIIDVFKKYIKK